MKSPPAPPLRSGRLTDPLRERRYCHYNLDTKMTFTHGLNGGLRGVASPLDPLLPGSPSPSPDTAMLPVPPLQCREPTVMYGALH